MTAIVLDTETTGFGADKNRIIELCIVSWETGEVLIKTYFDPEREISEEITRITGITNETVSGAPKWAEYGKRISDIIESAEVIIGYNPGFDKGMIDGEFARMGEEFKLKWPPLVDPKRIWDIYEPRESRHLQNAFKRFVDKAGFEGAHGALADTVATRDVLLKQVETFDLRREDGVIPWAELDPERKNWFGTSNHILWAVNDYAISGLSGERRLITNFGKHKGIPVVDIEVGFWRWVKERDFPDHILMMAIKMEEYSGLVANEIHLKIHTWAREYES